MTRFVNESSTVPLESPGGYDVKIAESNSDNTRLEQVVMTKSFSSIPSIFRRHLLPAGMTFASVIVGGLAYLTFTPRLYETSARLSIDDRQVSVSNLGRDLARLPDSAPGGSNPLATQAELVKSQRVLTRAIAKVAANGNQNIPTVDQLANGLRVQIVPATSILQLSYRGKDSQMVAVSLNAVMASIVEESSETIRVGARSVRKFLEAEVAKQRVLLEWAEKAENRYRQENALVSVESQTNELVQNLGEAENQERELSARLQEATSRNVSLQQVIGAGSLKNAYASVRIGQDEELRALRTKLDDLETRVIEGRIRLTAQNPRLVLLVEQRDQIRKLYKNKLSRILSGKQLPPRNVAGDALSQELNSKSITNNIEQEALKQKLVTVRNARANLQARLAALPTKQQPLTTLNRERKEAESTLALLQSKLQEAKIAEAQLVSNVQIISEAGDPTKAEWPKKPFVLVTATAFGLILAIGVVLLLELLDNSLHDSAEAEELLGQLSLGVLPSLPQPLIALRQPELFLDNSYLVEPYRKLLKTLEFRSGKKLRLLVISSALAKEGKSTVVSHLAAVSAMLFQRTLLIDADLRQPKQHSLFNLSPEAGLAEVIDGRVTLSQAIQPTSIANLFVLPCGKRPLRPSLVLESAELQSLLTEAAKSFALVILDTPPINSCADALVLSRYSDGLMFVVCPGLTTRSGLSQAMSELNKNGIPLMGFVANNVDSQIEQHYSVSNNRQKGFASFLQRLPLPRKLQQWSGINPETNRQVG